MSNIDLLSAVQPKDGYYAIVGIGDHVNQKFADSREAADKIINDFLSKRYDVYFGVAKYLEKGSRTKDNVKSLKSIWIDIDCGESKAVVNEKTGRPDGYIDHRAGINALRGFCAVVGLPRPVLVNSGRGIHAYWILDRELTRQEWEPIAERLRDICVTQEFYVDPSVFEVSRILRVPDTLNFKDIPPKPVEVISSKLPEPVSVEWLIDTLKVVVKKSKSLKEPSALQLKLMADNESSFKKIMIRSMAGEGCQQLKDCYENQTTLPEPRWFNALSIAKFCADKDSAIHKMSSKHQDYDAEETEHKIAHIKGPHTCGEFERKNPGGCEGCPLQGKINSPISLGREVQEAEPEDNEFEDLLSGTKVQIPTFPEPFFRGKSGGIYKRAKSDEEEDMLVYEHDLYVVKRMNDPEDGEVISMRLHLPMDGIKEFVVANYIVADGKELGKVLAKQGVVSNKKRFLYIVEYIQSATSELQWKRRAEQMRTQFGWADNHSKFIIGDREITPDGTFYSPPSVATRAFAEHYQESGELDKWKEVVALYNRPKQEPLAFAVLTAFGAPLLHMFGLSGAVINLISSDSGSGKSTALNVVNSVWGDPKKLELLDKDTGNSKDQILGIVNNLPFCVDEITNMDAKKLSDSLYSMSQGRGKHRMKASANELRINNTTWATISLTTSNSSSYEKLSALKANPEGENMRLLEYRIEKLPVNEAIPLEEAIPLFDIQLKENFGIAGTIYAEYMVSNYEYIKQSAHSIRRQLETKFKVTQAERFWTAVIAANITGGMIAQNQLGLINFDLPAIYKWVEKLFMELRENAVPPNTTPVSVLSAYINEHLGNVLVINDKVDNRGKPMDLQAMPISEPTRDLRIRYEPDTQMMYLAAGPFRKWCTTSQIDYARTLRELTKSGVVVNSGNKRLSKGLQVVSGAVHCVYVNAAHNDMVKVANLAEEAPVLGGT